MPSGRGNFVLLHAGSCSFCGKARAQVRALVATDGHTRICNECIGLCWDILFEDIDRVVPGDLHAHAGFDGASLDDENVGALMADVVRRLAETREARHAPAKSDQRSFSYVPRQTMPDLRCSFCGAFRRDVLELISGPRVFVCDGCVCDATEVVKDTLCAT